MSGRAMTAEETATKAAKHEKYIADAPKAAEEIKEGLAAHGAEMIAGGTVIDKDGKVNFGLTLYRQSLFLCMYCSRLPARVKRSGVFC